MAWQDTLLPASFKGLTFDCLQTDDEAARALAEHSYPFRDGADVEDLGRSARKVSIEAIFFGPDYEARLQAFIRVLDKTGAGVLVHPVFGSIKNSYVANYKVHHDADGVDQCKISLQFIESTTANPFFDRILPKQKCLAITQKISVVRAFANAILKNAVVAAVLGTVSTMRGYLNQAIGFYKEASAIVTSAMDYISYNVAFVTDLAAIGSSIIDGHAFSLDSVSADLQDLSHVFTQQPTLSSADGRVFYAVSPGAKPPADAQSGIYGLGYELGITSFDEQSLSGYTARFGASAFEAQVVLAHVLLDQACNLADTVHIILALETETPQLSPPAIEAMANAARESIERAIAVYRVLYPIGVSRTVIEPLKDLAFSVQEAAQAVIALRPPLVKKVVNLPGNLRLIAFNWYGDHSRSDELWRLNPQLIAPNFIVVGTVLNAYAQ